MFIIDMKENNLETSGLNKIENEKEENYAIRNYVLELI
jgi:hypothetical protein